MTKQHALNLVMLSQTWAFSSGSLPPPSLGLIDGGIAKTGNPHTQEVTKAVHQPQCLITVVPPYPQFCFPRFQIQRLTTI